MLTCLVRIAAKEKAVKKEFSISTSSSSSYEEDAAPASNSDQVTPAASTADKAANAEMDSMTAASTATHSIFIPGAIVSMTILTIAILL